MNKIMIRTEYIKLGQLLKLAGIISNGSDAKIFLEGNEVLVNSTIENRRGRKIYPDFIVEVNNTVIKVVKDEENWKYWVDKL